MKELIKFLINLDMWGIGLLIVRFMDGFKYHLESAAMKRAGIAKGRSRKFINYAWLADFYMIMYLLHNKIDWYLLISFIMAIFFMTEYWLALYTLYPYRMRGCANFKRPNVFIYLINSLLPNRLRKRL